jgi:site-specific DNA-methyltransferase (adenine-specific)
LHPTMKDIKVIKHLVELLSNEWDLVLDPFMWSWTTAVACKELWRRFIWSEIDPKYVEIANRRLEETEFIQQQRLF